MRRMRVAELGVVAAIALTNVAFQVFLDINSSMIVNIVFFFFLPGFLFVKRICLKGVFEDAS